MKLEDMSIKTEFKPNILSIRPNGVEIIKIDSDGNIFWKCREVKTDDDFKRAMLDLAACLVGTYKKEEENESP